MRVNDLGPSYIYNLMIFNLFLKNVIQANVLYEGLICPIERVDLKRLLENSLRPIPLAQTACSWLDFLNKVSQRILSCINKPLIYI